MTLKYLISLFSFQALFYACTAQCPDGYNPQASMCVLMGSKTMPWANAQKMCQQDNATLIGAAVAPDQWAQVTENVPSSYLTTVWLGLHYDKTSQTWSWSDGSPYDPVKDWAPWGTGQPNTKSGECVIVKADTKKDKFLWFMTTCTQAMKPVCIKQAPTTIGTGTPPTMPNFPNVTCPPGLNGFAGTCMKYSQDPVTYDEAQTNCAANNSYTMFTKDSQFWSYAEYAIGPQLPNFWIGLRYDTASKQFKYANGDTYDKDKDWAPWAKDMPGTPGDWAGDCVGVQQDYETSRYQWIMKDCNEGLTGVCLYNMPTTSVAVTTVPVTSTSTSTPTSTTTTLEPTTASTSSTPASTVVTTEPVTTASTASTPTTTTGQPTLAKADPTTASSTGQPLVTSGPISSSTAGQPQPLVTSGSVPPITTGQPLVTSGPISSSTTGQPSVTSGPTTLSTIITGNPNSSQPQTSTASKSIQTSSVPNAAIVASSTIANILATSGSSKSVVTSIAGMTVGSSAVPNTTAHISTKAPSCNRTGQFRPAPENGKLAFLPFEITNTTDVNECGKSCLTRYDCASIDYNKSNLECRLFSKTFDEDCMQFIRDTNYQHYDLISIQ